MRERKKQLVGRVVGNKMDKTVVVAVQSLRRHRLYQRTMRLTKNYMAHDEENSCQVGDLVRLLESRPISRHKHWRVADVIERVAERGKAVDIPSVAPAVTAELTAIATADVDAEVLGEAQAEADERSDEEAEGAKGARER
jgi:small subunit ribosomal protein S17